MKVAFDLKNLWLYGKGIGLFTNNLLSDLASNDNHMDTSIQLYSPSFNVDGLQFINQNPRFDKITTGIFDKKGKLSKVVYDQLTLFKSLKQNKPDILFSPYFDIPVFWNKPAITTIHDLSIFEMKGVYSKPYYMYSEILLKNAIKRSSFIVTVSDYSKRKLIETFNISPQKIKIFYNKVSLSFLENLSSLKNVKAEAMRETYNLPKEYILYTGGLEARKNIKLLIEGINSARKKNKSIPKLVITGVNLDKVSAVYKELLRDESIIVLGFLHYYEIFYLYKHASLIVNTSSYEGFGIPILEALTLQQPMLCSNIAVYEEIGKECVYYFRNNDVSSFEEQLILFFSGKLPSINKTDMFNRSEYYNSKNYSEIFFQMVNKSI